MADDSPPIDQNEIEQLLAQAAKTPAGAAPSGKPAPSSKPAPNAAAADPNAVLGQSEIESLLSAGGVGAAAKFTPGKPPAKAGPPNSEASIDSADIEYLLQQAEQALASVNAPVNPSGMPAVQAFKLRDFSSAAPNVEAATLELIRDVELDLKIELGRTQMYLEDVLRLRKGSVVPLDKLAGDPVDIYVNGRLIARGEVLVLNDNFCVRVAELIAGESAV